MKLDVALRAHYFDLSHDPAALEDYLRQTFTAALASSAVLFGAMLAIGEPLFAFLFASGDVEFYSAGAIAAATAAINGSLAVYFVYLRNHLELRELMVWQLAVAVGTIVCQLGLVLQFKLGLYGVLWGSLLPAAATLLAICAVRPSLVGLRLDWRRLQPSLAYSLPLVVLAVCLVLASRLDRLVLQRHVELADVGVYALLMSVLGLLAMALAVLDNAIRPYLFERLKQGGARTGDAIESYQQLYCFGGLVTLSVAVFFGANLELIVKDAGYLTMREWLPLGATASLPMILVWFHALLHEFQKRSLELALSVGARLTALFVLLVLLVPPFGVGGAIVALGAAEALMAVVIRALAVRRLETRPSLRGVWLQMALFLAGLWSAAAIAGPRSPALAGTLQLVVVCGLLLAVNRRVLQRLARRTDIDGGTEAASVGRTI